MRLLIYCRRCRLWEKEWRSSVNGRAEWNVLDAPGKNCFAPNLDIELYGSIFLLVESQFSHQADAIRAGGRGEGHPWSGNFATGKCIFVQKLPKDWLIFNKHSAFQWNFEQESIYGKSRVFISTGLWEITKRYMFLHCLKQQSIKNVDAPMALCCKAVFFI